SHSRAVVDVVALVNRAVQGNDKAGGFVEQSCDGVGVGLGDVEGFAVAKEGIVVVRVLAGDVFGVEGVAAGGQRAVVARLCADRDARLDVSRRAGAAVVGEEFEGNRTGERKPAGVADRGSVVDGRVQRQRRAVRDGAVVGRVLYR